MHERIHKKLCDGVAWPAQPHRCGSYREAWQCKFSYLATAKQQAKVSNGG